MSEVSPVAAKVGAHLGCALGAVASVRETYPLWEHANVQRGIDAYLAARPGEAEWFGVGPGHGHEDLATMLTAAGPGGQVTAVVHGTAAIGPDAVMEVVLAGAVLAQRRPELADSLPSMDETLAVAGPSHKQQTEDQVGHEADPHRRDGCQDDASHGRAPGGRPAGSLHEALGRS